MVAYSVDNFAQHELDEALRESVNSSLERDGVIRESRMPLEVTAENGVVTLSGVVLSEIMHDRVLFRAATTPGVTKVIDHLISDPAIEAEIASRISSTQNVQAQVNSYMGNIMLNGVVQDDKQRNEIVNLTQGVAGVRSVVDNLVIAPGDN
nr:BON domain-containing protein [Anaerolineae bacterium]